jgi:hypothetical protein
VPDVRIERVIFRSEYWLFCFVQAIVLPYRTVRVVVQEPIFLAVNNFPVHVYFVTKTTPGLQVFTLYVSL